MATKYSVPQSTIIVCLTCGSKCVRFTSRNTGKVGPSYCSKKCKLAYQAKKSNFLGG